MFLSLWLYNIARGIDTEPVKARTVAKSIGCCKNFKGYLALASKNDVRHWLAELCAEIYERVQDDLITVKYYCSFFKHCNFIFSKVSRFGMYYLAYWKFTPISDIPCGLLNS